MDDQLIAAIRLFEELEPLDEVKRRERLAEQPAELVSQVRALLDGAARRGVLDGPAPSLGDVDAADSRASLAPGTRIGLFSIVAPIGMGGMGEVYLAERSDAGFVQRVALKLLRIDAMPNAALFASERRMLAQLEHPAIARLIDGGITPEGRPWMAMDYIEGEPLDRWCAANRPPLEARLAIFTQICEAVAHAHANLIVHRDLKPSNVLIDAAGRPHLLDFGIAKLIGDGNEAAATTLALATPDYAAPEQFDAGPITTATDVHALGALLFEMLTGRRPWQGGGSLPAMVRRIVSEEPPVPSKVAGAAAEPPVPPGRLKGDLDAIVAQAMRKEPARRYGTVDALLDDISRARTLRPVRARQGSRRYRFGRFVRRNRVPMMAAAAVVVALLGGIATTAIQAHRAAVARDLALAEARRSDSIVQTLTLMLGGNPGAASDLTVKQTMDRAAARMLTTLDRSEQSGEAVTALGDLFANMADVSGEFSLYQGALARRIGADSPLQTARMQANLGDAAVSLSKLDMAAPLLDRADAFFRTDPDRFVADHLQVQMSRAGIARRKGDYDTAIRLMSTDLAGVETALAGNDTALLTRYNNLFVYLIESNRLDQVPPLLARIDRVLAHPGARDTIQAIGLEQLRGVYLLRKGDAAGAERVTANVVARERKLFGENSALASSLTQLGKSEIAQGKFVAAETALAEAQPMAERYMGGALPAIVTTLALAQTRAELGKLDAARATLAIAEKALAPLPKVNPLTGQYELTKAVVALASGQKPLAQAAAGQARAAFEAMGPAGKAGLAGLTSIDRRIAALR